MGTGNEKFSIEGPFKSWQAVALHPTLIGRVLVTDEMGEISEPVHWDVRRSC
jgi:hypothetical protein